jgi:ABC-type sugar transport system ATPase subunit
LTASRLELRKVSKTYESDGQKIPALCEVSHAFKPGSVTALLGRSGCGKTTLLNMAGAMDFPTSGEVLIDGSATSALKDGELTALRRTRIGFVFQFFQLLPTLTILENVELPLLLAGAQETGRMAVERLDWVGLKAVPSRGETPVRTATTTSWLSCRMTRRRSVKTAIRGLGIAKDLLVWTRSEFEKRLHLKASLPSTIIREGKLLHAA